MKKLFALILAGALAASSLTACGSTAVVAVPQPEATTPPAAEPARESTPESSGAAVKTGFYLGTDISGSKSAAAEEEGMAQANLELVAVTLTDEGVIDECVIDAIQSKINFDATGAITTDLTAPVLSKNELGDGYGMKKASAIGKEWNEQVQALADYVEGKTLEEIRGIAVTEEGKAGEADLAASVTISIAGYLDAIEQAAANATHLGAQQGDTLVLTTATDIAGSKDVGPEGDGTAQTYATVAAITLNGDVITSCIIDAVQADVNFDTTGTITTDLTAPVLSKNALGD
ncbi:hypothetical protein, partial [Subdoligranulum variabile]|uniref:hypothetical protein n=1 Tax=Subdoligranulum variabile TaxID=214851 RepID=UPI0026F379D3